MNYLEQLEKAILFIEANLCEDIRTEDVAGIAGYSYYHFHRVFEAVTGETIGNYIRSRRLARAAYDLMYSDVKIIDIAVRYQFESQEAFNRAFKKLYKISPGTYRNNRIDSIVGNRKQLTPLNLRHLTSGLTLQPEIKIVSETKIVGLSGKSSLSCNNRPNMWNMFNPRINEIKHLAEGIRGYGICEADPDFDMCRFDENTESSEIVGVEVISFEDIPRGMIKKFLTGGKYAVFTHKGKLDKLGMTYEYIWGTWILCSGVELDMRDDFEFYDERFLGYDNELSQMDIYIPVK